MVHPQHYFELTLTLDPEKFNKLLNRANDELVDNALASKGITITYHDNSYKKKVKFTVNSNWILGGDEPDHKNISKLLRKLETHIGDYFNSKYTLNDFKLTRMGIIADIDVRKRERVGAYLKVIQRIGKVKGFSPSSDSRLDDDISFCLEGNSNGIDFMIYDLEKLVKDQLETESRRKLRSIEERTEGILRAEVWLTAQKAIRASTDETVASKQIVDLMENSGNIFLETSLRIIPFGSFYKKNKAVEVIERKVTDKTLKRKMLRLLELIPEKKSLLLAQKALDYRRIEDVMYMFFSIDVSPVTISKRHGTKYLKNLYDYL
jgi:hypothetical protein